MKLVPLRDSAHKAGGLVFPDLQSQTCSDIPWER